MEDKTASQGPDIAPAETHDRDVENFMAEKEKGADALLTYIDHSGTAVLDDATNKRLLWKIDTHILPWLCCLYILQYLDKGV